MTFSIAGSTITQSGTDTSLSGLTGLAGITKTTSGNKSTYSCPAMLLVVTGTLTIDPRTEMIINLGSFRVANAATLNLGVAYTSSFGTPAATLYSEGLAIQLSSSVNSTQGGFAGIEFQAGCNVNWQGATVQDNVASGAVNFHHFNGTVRIRSGEFRSSNLNNPRIRASSANIDIDAFSYEGVQFDALMTPTINTILKGMSPKNIGVGIENALNLGAGSSAVQTFDGVPASTGKVAAISSNWQGLNDVRLVNCEAGSLEIVMPDSTGNTGTAGHGGRIYQRFRVRAQTLASSGIWGAMVYLKDTNNGNRKVKNIFGGAVIDHTADQVLISTTDVNGYSPTQSLLTSHVYRNNTVGDISAPDGQEIRDLRGKINTAGSDLFDIYLLAYGYQTTGIIDAPMKGMSDASLSAKMLADTNVTLSETNAITKLSTSFIVNSASNTITVTAASTLDDLYDAMKAWKTRNVQSQLEYPSISAQPVVGSGDTLVTSMTVIGAEFLTNGTKFKNLQTNVTAASAIGNLSIIGNVSQNTPTNLTNVSVTGTLTYNTNSSVVITYTGTNIATVSNTGTGVITINRVNSSIDDYTDAEVNFIDSSLLVAGAEGVTFYPTEVDRDTNTNPSGTFASQLVFKFGSTINGTLMSGMIYLRCISGGVFFSANKEITLGDNIVDLGVNAQLAAINARVVTIQTSTTLLPEKLTTINNGVKKSSLLIPHSESL